MISILLLLTILPGQEDLRRQWPRGIEYPKGMRFYRPTEYSQRIAETYGTDGRLRATNLWYHKNRDDIWTNDKALNPNRTDKRWVAPGGLADVKGWTHAPAIYLPSRPILFEQRIQIANGNKLPAKRWTFPDGTIVADLLMLDSEPFELRFAEKRDGKWVRYVAFKNHNARPTGYHGAGRKCAECHDLAGTSEQYGITVRGCDGVFSYNPYEGDIK